MASRRRIAWVIVALMVLGGTGLGVWWYIRQNTGPRLLARAELAVRAGKLERGLSLAEDFIAKYPDDWRGYFTKANALGRQGRYEQARAPLKKALSLPGADITPITIRLADTYALSAVRAISERGGAVDANTLAEAAGLLAKAEEILAGLKPSDPAGRADVLQTRGLNCYRLSRVHQAWADLLEAQAQAAKAGGQSPGLRETLQQAEYHRAQAAKAGGRAIEALLPVVREDPSRDAPAETLVNLCIERSDAKTLAEVRKAFLTPGGTRPAGADPNAPGEEQLRESVAPVAWAMLVMHELSRSMETGDRSYAAALARAERNLDRLPEAKYGRNVHVKLMKARVQFMKARDLRVRAPLDANAAAARAEEICGEILKIDPVSPRARLLRARAMLLRSECGPGAKTNAAKLAAAEEELFGLRSKYPGWDQAHYWYAVAAQRTGKTELAREAMRAVTRIYSRRLERGELTGVDRELHVRARRRLVEYLLATGFYEEAIREAQAYHTRWPDDPEGLLFVVRTAQATDQPGRARQVLDSAWQAQRNAKGPAALRMLKAVADGYRLLGEASSVEAVAEAILARSKGRAPSTAEAAVAVASALTVKGRYPEAEKLLTDMLAGSPPGAAELCYSLGALYRAQGQSLAAEEAFRRAIRLDPRRSRYRLALAETLVDFGQLDEATDLLKPILGEDIAAELLNLRLRLLRGLPIDAEMQTLLRRPDAGKRFGRQLAYIYLANGEPDRCRDLCEQLLARDPNRPDLREPLARAYLVMGDRAKGIAEWKRILTANPRSLPPYERLGGLLLGEAVLEAAEEAAGDGQKPPSVVRRTPEEFFKDLSAVRAQLADVPGARPELVEIALGEQCAAAGLFAQAIERYRAALGETGIQPAMAFLARSLAADALARTGKVDEALAECDRLLRMAAKLPWRQRRVKYARARLLAGAGRKEQARAALADLCSRAEKDEDYRSLAQAAELQAAMGETDQALATCEALQRLLPADSRSYVLRARILASAGRTEEVPALYEQAVKYQPTNVALYTALAGAYEARSELRRALEALERLGSVGKYGRPLALLYQGDLLARWGLQSQAVEKFQALAALGYGPSPRVRLSLAVSLARLGRKDEAREAIASISKYARQYVPGQLLRAELADTPAEALAVLDELGKARPADERVVLGRMGLLLREKKPAEALAAFEAFRDSDALKGRLPVRPARLALTAALRAGQVEKARRLAESVADRNPTPQWQLIAAVLTMDSDPQAARRRLPEPDAAGVYPAAVGLCLARRGGTPNDALPWARRIDALHAALRARPRPTGVPATLRLLCALLAGQKSQATAAMSEMGSGADPEVVRELISHDVTRPETVAELVRLVKAHVARQLQLPELAETWAMEALKARPSCLWAGMEVAIAATDAEQVRAALALLRPPDSHLAQRLRAELALREGRPAEAARLFAALAARGPEPDATYLVRQAMALEDANRPAEALAAYRKALSLRQDPVAANNAAGLVVRLAPTDANALAEARSWVEAALKKITAPHLYDTAGWVAHLQGRDAEALVSLRRAVRGLPAEPEVHYHLGVVEAAAGRKETAGWHLAAAVDLAGRLAGQGRALTSSCREAVRRAREALASLGKNRTGN